MKLTQPTHTCQLITKDFHLKMITLLSVFSIWNISLYLYSEVETFNSMSSLFVISLAILPNAVGLLAALSDGLSTGYDKDTRLMLLTSLSPLISVCIYHLGLSDIFSHPIERFMFANGITIFFSIAVLVLLTILSECLTPNEN